MERRAGLTRGEFNEIALPDPSTTIMAGTAGAGASSPTAPSARGPGPSPS